MLSLSDSTSGRWFIISAKQAKQGETTDGAAPAGTEPDKTLLDHMGGVVGLVYSGLPSIVYVAVDAVAGLNTAVGVALGTGAGITLLRLLRREPVQPAVSGLLGVGVAAFIAYQTGDARDYFLIGIWLSLALAVLFLGSVLVRRPLAGVIWNLLAGKGNAWRDDPVARRGYDIATLAMVTVFAARFVVQQWLYVDDATGWLAFARIAMGYPLLGLALLVMAWAVRRANRRLDYQVQTPASASG